MMRYRMEAYPDDEHCFLEYGLFVPLDAPDDEAAIASPLWHAFMEKWLGLPDAHVMLARLDEEGGTEDIIDGIHEICTAELRAEFDYLVSAQVLDK